jgi:hypothetical protein
MAEGERQRRFVGPLEGGWTAQTGREEGKRGGREPPRRPADRGQRATCQIKHEAWGGETVTPNQLVSAKVASLMRRARVVKVDQVSARKEMALARYRP